MKKIIFILLFVLSTTGITIAQESPKTSTNDSSQVEFYTSMEEFFNKNVLPLHITILAVTENIYEIFGSTIDFKAENFPTKKENENYYEEGPSKIVL